jgi:DNA end-binding protein Ku
MAAIWKGSISFGLVNIPVALHAAEKRDEDLDFTLLDRRDFSPIGYRKVNKATGEEVPRDQIAKGFEVEDGRYVLIEDEDFKRASPEKTQRIDIVAFIDLGDIPVTYFDKPYYLEAVAKQEKGYVLLREALKKANKAGIAKVVIRSRQYLAALIPQDNSLVLNLLRYPAELRDTKPLNIPDSKKGAVSDKELQMAGRLIDDLAEKWKPEQYKDEYRGQLVEFIKKKAEKGDTGDAPADAEEEAAPRGKVIDMMALLKRSVEKAESHKQRPRRHGRTA